MFNVGKKCRQKQVLKYEVFKDATKGSAIHGHM